MEKKITIGKYASLTTVRNGRVLYRLTPHTSTLNNTNRRLWYTLHEIMSMYDSPRSRLSRKGLHFTYRLKDDIWWIVTFRAKSTNVPESPIERQVEFYICLPETFAEVFFLKLKSHEQWKKCIPELVSFDTLDFPIEDLDVYQLRYTKSNIFSLNHDYARHTTPIRELVHVSQEMQVDDFVGLFTRFETVDRKRWKGIADYAWEIWDKGGVPRRNGFDPAAIWKIFQGLAFGVLIELKNVIDSTFAAIENTVFNGRHDNPERIKIEVPDAERAELLINGSLSTYTRNKRNLPVFATSMNVLVHASTQARRDMLAHSVSSAFGDLAGDQRLELVKVRMHYGKQIKEFEVPTGRHLDNYMSVDEIGKVVQLPTADVQEEFKDALEVNTHVELDIPQAFTDEDGIYVGTARRRGETIPIYIPKKNPDKLMLGRVFTGSQGMGKDQAIINLVVESKLKHGIGAVIVDVVDERVANRGMADTVRDHLPASEVIDLNLGNYEYPIYIGLAEAVGNLSTMKAHDARIAASMITNELVQFIMGDDFENYQTRNYLRAMSRAVGADIVLIKRMLTDASFRKEKIAEQKALGRDTELLDTFDGMGSARNISGPIFVRLAELTEDEILRPMFCQNPNPAIKLRQWLKEGKVIIYRIPRRNMTDSTIRTLCYWVILNIYLTKLSMDGQGAMTWLVLNEPHQFLSKPLIDYFKRILVEGRKWRLAPIFAFHEFELFREHNGFVDVLKSGAAYWHIFKNSNIAMYQKMKPYLEPSFTPEQAMQATKQYQFIAKWLDGKGEDQPAFLMDPPKQVFERYPTQDNSSLTLRHSRMYGKHIDIVEKEIQVKSKKAT